MSNSSKKEFKVFNTPVISVDSLYKINKNLRISIAIGKKEISRKVKLHLLVSFREQIEVIEYDSFIEDNLIKINFPSCVGGIALFAPQI